MGPNEKVIKIGNFIDVDDFGQLIKFLDAKMRLIEIQNFQVDRTSNNLEDSRQVWRRRDHERKFIRTVQFFKIKKKMKIVEHRGSDKNFALEIET